MRIEHAAEILASRSDADSLAAAGLLDFPKYREKSLALLARSTALAPDRADLAWLRTQICQATPTCDPRPLEQSLRDLDTSNGASWLGALARADSAEDEDARVAALQEISHSERVDVYWTTLIWRLSRATAASGVVSLADADILVTGVLAAEAIPAYKAASDACKGQRLQSDDREEVCRGVADAFLRGDTYVTELLGGAIAERVWPENSPQWKAASEARQIWEFRSNALIQSGAWNVVGVDRYLTFCAQNRREQDVDKALLLASGRNPEPPSSVQ